MTFQVLYGKEVEVVHNLVSFLNLMVLLRDFLHLGCCWVCAWDKVKRTHGLGWCLGFQSWPKPQVEDSIDRAPQTRPGRGTHTKSEDYEGCW